MSHLSPRPHVPSYGTCKTLIAFCLEAIQSSWWWYSLFQNTQHSTLPRSCLTTMRVPTVLCKNGHLSVCISFCISVRSHVCSCSATYPALQEHCCKPPVGNNSENEISILPLGRLSAQPLSWLVRRRRTYSSYSSNLSSTAVTATKD